MENEAIERVGLWGLAAALLLGGIASAATPIPRTLEQLSRRAETVVVGTIGEQESRYDERGTLILTHTTLAVEQTIAGAPASAVTFSEYGGCVGTRCLATPGIPRYAPGQRVALFLCRSALGRLETCGATQGRLTLLDTPDGRTRAIGAMAGERIDETLAELRARILLARGEERP